MTVRPETPADFAAVRQVHCRAFPTEVEADLVERLRKQPGHLPGLSLVAEEAGEILGHVILSPVTVEGRECGVLGLGPVGVLPSRQRQGIGAALMHAAIAESERLGYGGIVLLGHPEYYPRFGFQPASRFRLTSIYQVPDEAFMALPLRAGSLEGVSGQVRYSAPFDEL